MDDVALSGVVDEHETGAVRDRNAVAAHGDAERLTALGGSEAAQPTTNPPPAPEHCDPAVRTDCPTAT